MSLQRWRRVTNTADHKLFICFWPELANKCVATPLQLWHIFPSDLRDGPWPLVRLDWPVDKKNRTWARSRTRTSETVPRRCSSSTTWKAFWPQAPPGPHMYTHGYSRMRSQLQTIRRSPSTETRPSVTQPLSWYFQVKQSAQPSRCRSPPSRKWWKAASCRTSGSCLRALLWTKLMVRRQILLWLVKTSGDLSLFSDRLSR